MNQPEEYITLDLKALMFDILRHWKKIILAGIALAVLMGGAMGYKGHSGNNALDSEEYAKEIQDHQENVAIYEEARLYHQKKIDDLQDALLHNDLLLADSEHVYIINASYYIDNGVQSSEEPDTLVQNYCTALWEDSVYEQISQMTDITVRDAKSLIQIGVINAESFFIKVIHPDKDVSVKIMQYLQDFVQDIYKKLDSDLENHILKLMSNSGGFGPSDALANLQYSNYYSLVSSKNELKEVEKILEDLERSAPAEQIVTNSFVKWFLLGGVGGAMLAAAYYLFASLFSGKVNSIEQVADSYNTTVLGEILLENVKRSKTDRFLDKLEGKAGENTEENIRYIAENIRNHCTGDERILVCCDEGSQSCDFVESMKKYLPEIQLTPAENLLKNPDALQQFGKCDTVLRLVTKNGTSSKAIAKEWKMLREFNKKLLGVVFFY